MGRITAIKATKWIIVWMGSITAIKAAKWIIMYTGSWRVLSREKDIAFDSTLSFGEYISSF